MFELEFQGFLKKLNFFFQNFNIKIICLILSPFVTIDNLSAENSPLHDIVLQSAPGSPGSYPIVHAENQGGDGKQMQFICLVYRFYVNHV